ncbi:hypothetical protein LG943_11865 [Streptomonospora sp. S1-112]|uniref:Uncharacterized protein n=1 Tax=Streptomonospora mangrovi TaxID=2883123 RepID=A0A9X3NVJ4_9ACTN|nr:hypothetical protein [Streptomonospora mangrovi]MDA0565011.1 hypothetical protein [Streptomonospora mangrovi]
MAGPVPAAPDPATGPTVSAVPGSATARAFMHGPTGPQPSAPATGHQRRFPPRAPTDYERQLRALPGVPVSFLPRLLYKATGGRLNLSAGRKTS